MKNFGKLYTIILGLILIILGVRLLWFLIEANKTMVMPAYIGFAGYISMLLLTMAGIYMIFSTIDRESQKAVINSKKEYQQWLTKRIKEIEIEYDEAQTASYGTGLKYDSTATQRVISKGSKLRAYKEILDYIITH